MLSQQTKLRVSDGMGWVHVDHHGWLRPDADESDAVLFELEPYGARYRVKAPDGRYIDVADEGRVGLCSGRHAECTLGPSLEGVGRPLRIDGVPLEVGIKGSRVYFRLRDSDGAPRGPGGCITVMEESQEPAPAPPGGFLLVAESAFFHVLMREIDLKKEFDYEDFDRLDDLATVLVSHIDEQARSHGLRSPAVRRDLYGWLIDRLEEADVVVSGRLETVTSELLAEAQGRLLAAS